MVIAGYAMVFHGVRCVFLAHLAVSFFTAGSTKVSLQGPQRIYGHSLGRKPNIHSPYLLVVVLLDRINHYQNSGNNGGNT